MTTQNIRPEQSRSSLKVLQALEQIQRKPEGGGWGRSASQGGARGHVDQQEARALSWCPACSNQRAAVTSAP